MPYTAYLLTNFHLFILVEQILISIAGTPLTLSELEQETRLYLAIQRDGYRANTINLDSDTLCKSLRKLTAEWLIEAEAKRLSWPEAKPDLINQRLYQLRLHFESEEAYQRFLREQELTKSDLTAIFARQIRVESMIRHYVTDQFYSDYNHFEQSVNDYYQSNPGKFNSLEEAAADMKMQIIKRSAEWLKELAERHKMQQVIPPDNIQSPLTECVINGQNLLLGS